jgi:SPP1 family predicted phage head-tail adaptor
MGAVTTRGRIRAGQMRHRLTLQRPVESRDAQGGVTYAWAAMPPRVPASVEVVKGAEGQEAAQTAARRSYRVETRYRADIEPKRRFVFGSKVLNIVSVENQDERNYALVCLCEHAPEETP